MDWRWPPNDRFEKKSLNDSREMPIMLRRYTTLSSGACPSGRLLIYQRNENLLRMKPSKQDYLDAIQTVEHTHSAPAVIARVLPLLRREDVMVQEIVDLLRVDVSLTGEIIRTSNSVFMQRSEPVVSLDAAVGRLGLNEVLCHVSLSLARDTLTRHLEYYGKSAESLQHESIACALVMERLAKLMGLNASEAYTLGILHAVGYLVLNEVLNNFEHEGSWDGEEAVETWERAVTGFDHAEAGSFLIKNWSFPKEFCEAVAHQLEVPKSLKPNSFERALPCARALFPLILSDVSEKALAAADLQSIEEALGMGHDAIVEMLLGAREAYLELIHQLSGGSTRS